MTDQQKRTSRKELDECVDRLRAIPFLLTLSYKLALLDMTNKKEELEQAIESEREDFKKAWFKLTEISASCRALEEENARLVEAIQKIHKPDYAGVDGMIIADMGFQHFAQTTCKLVLEKTPETTKLLAIREAEQTALKSATQLMKCVNEFEDSSLSYCSEYFDNLDGALANLDAFREGRG